MEYSAIYEQKTRLIDKFDPRTKFAWYIVMIYFSLRFQLVLQLTCVFLANILVSFVLTKSLKQYKILLILMPFLGVQLLILQVLFCRDGVLLYEWGLIKIYSQAISLTITGLLKAGIIVLAGMQFFTSVSSMDFTLMLIKFKIPYRYAMLVGLCARFIPLMRSEYTTIIDSQTTRGLKMESVYDKIRSIIPTFLPFLFRSVRRATETALTMELRGYGRGKYRTFSYDICIKKTDIVLIGGMISVVLLNLIGRVFCLW